MNKLKKVAASIICKYGSVIASLAFFAVTVAANSPCRTPFYEPEEPVGLDRFKRFNK